MRAGRWLAAVWLTAVLGFVLAPLVVVLVGSFSASGGRAFPPDGLTLRWYGEVFRHEPFRTGLINSLLVAAVATILALSIGTAAAYAVDRHRFPGRAALRALFIAPLSVPRIVIGFALFVLLVTAAPRFYGSVAGVALAHGLILLPFVVSIVGAALAGLDPALEEAGRDLGLGPFATFRRVTLPQLRIGLTTAGVFAFVTSFDEVDTSIFLIRPGQSTLPIEMFLYLEQSQDPTLAALSAILIGFSVAAVALLAVVAGSGGLLRALGTGTRR
ncbi:ABC transporter permease [Streptosporangium violaceochromogenes]|nr:ABC transporter permease [Streptosporangium violaceochromogenes]